MGVFDIFRKPRVQASYLNAESYIRSSERQPIADPGSLPSVAEPLGEPKVIANEAEKETALDLAEMLADASQAAEEDAGVATEYKPLTKVSPVVYSEILHSDYPDAVSAMVRLNARFARDHESWMRTLESDLTEMERSGDRSYSFTEGLRFRNQQLRIRQDCLEKVRFGLKSVYTARDALEAISAKIQDIEEATSTSNQR